MKILIVIAYSLIVSTLTSPYALICAAILPLMLLCAKKIPIHHVKKINVMNAFMIMTLGLTWPSLSEGFVMGMIIALRVNMIYIAFAGLVLPMGMGAVYALPLPEKLRVLIILTVRGIYVMKDSLDSALISVRLRAPGLKGIARLKVFAYVVGNVLLRSEARSERMRLAIISRGGFGGFRQNA